MTLRKAGGLAALTCAATYVTGFALLVTVLAPTGYGTAEIDAAAVVALIAERPGLLIAWNTAIYIVNALALALLVAALHGRIAATRPDVAPLTAILGTIWTTLVLGAGMIANVTVERVHALAADPEAAATLWQMLHAVELGLGGGNEIAGGAWIATVSLAAVAAGVFGRAVASLGATVGTAGVATILPPLGEIAGAVFGLGAILWFIAVGVSLLRGRAAGGRPGPALRPRLFER